MSHEWQAARGENVLWVWPQAAREFDISYPGNLSRHFQVFVQGESPDKKVRTFLKVEVAQASIS